jgi:hypothetical protein
MASVNRHDPEQKEIQHMPFHQMKLDKIEKRVALSDGGASLLVTWKQERKREKLLS